MKSAYELAMERLKASDTEAAVELTKDQKRELADIDSRYKAKLAEREIFLRKALSDAQAAGQEEEVAKVQEQLRRERARLEEEREDEKNKVRRKK